MAPNVFVERFRSLLHLTLAAPQDLHGQYPQVYQQVTNELLEAHFSGKIALGFALLEGGTRGDALFGGLDVDKGFEHRLAVFERAIRGVGGDALAACAFATTGSMSGRGKIIFTIERPTDPHELRTVLAAVRKAAIADHAFGALDARSDVEVRPTHGQGGCLRILGRNLGRGGFLESPLTLDGELSDLQHVRPLPIATLRALVGTIAERAKQTWVDVMVATPWSYVPDGTRGVITRMCALARAAVARAGDSASAYALYTAWLSEVARNSPALNRPSPKNGDLRNPVKTRATIDRMWALAVRTPTTFVPKDVIGSGLPPRIITDYRALVGFVQQTGLAHALFAMDYDRVRELLGARDKKAAWRRMQRLVACELVVIVDRGAKTEFARRGLPTMFGLVGRNQTPADVEAAVRSNPRSHARLLARAKERAARTPSKVYVMSAYRARRRIA